MENVTHKKGVVDFTTRPLLKKTVLFALPLILTSVLQLLYNAADLIVLGKWADDSEAAVAAVGSTGALINLITNLFIGLSVGALAVVARFIGARDHARVAKSVHTSIVVSVIGGVVVGVFGFLCSRMMLTWMDTPDEVLGKSALYLKIYFCGMPFNLLYNFGASILRACGDTRRPLAALAFAGVANIGLNIFTVAGLHMGVAGVGIATTVSQALSAAGVVFFLCRRRDAARLCFRKLRIHKAELCDIIKIGLPAGLQGTIFSLSNVVIQSAINGFDSVAVMTGNAAAANVEGFVYVSMNAVAQSCLTVAGQNYGAAKPENIDLSLMQCLLLGIGIGLVLGMGVWALGKPLLKVYGCSGEANAYGVERLSVICTLYFLCAVMDIFVGALRGIGQSFAPMIVSIAGVVGVRVLWVYTIFRAHHTLLTLYISYPVSWAITFTIHAVCYLVVRKKKFPALRAMRENREKATENAGDAADCVRESADESTAENTAETIAENTENIEE